MELKGEERNVRNKKCGCKIYGGVWADKEIRDTILWVVSPRRGRWEEKFHHSTTKHRNQLIVKGISNKKKGGI